MLFNILLVGLGGCLGSVARFITIGWVNRFVLLAQFPFATLVVNVLGCFIIGFLGGLAINKATLSEQYRIFLFTGVLGGFTTFSAFGLETFHLLRNAQWLMAFLNIAAQIILGIGATIIGYWLSKHF